MKYDDLIDTWVSANHFKEFCDKEKGSETVHEGYLNLNHPAKVIYNPPATIVIWPMGDKTVVKCCEDDIYDPMTGFLLCCLKHYLGADNDPAKFHRFLKDFGPKPEQYDTEGLLQVYTILNNAWSKAASSIGDAMARILDGIANTFGGSDKEIHATDVVEQPHWIPVSERLPDEHRPVLAYRTDDDFYYICSVISGVRKFLEDYKFTHWMPLPEPPKEDA